MIALIPGTSTPLKMTVRTAAGAIPATAPTLVSVALEVESTEDAVELSAGAGAWNALGYFGLDISKDDIAETLLYKALRLTWVFDIAGSQRTEYMRLEVREDDTLLYGSVSDVCAIANLRAEDFGLATERQLGRLVCSWLASAKSFIDADRRRTYDPVPDGIDSIATRIAANMGAVAHQRRKSPFVRVNEFSVKLIEDACITSAIRDDLEVYPRASGRSIGFGIANSVSRDITDALEEA